MGMLDKTGAIAKDTATEERVLGFALWLRFLGWLSVVGVALLLLLALTTKGSGLYFFVSAVMNALMIPLLFGRASEAESVAMTEVRVRAIEAMLSKT